MSIQGFLVEFLGITSDAVSAFEAISCPGRDRVLVRRRGPDLSDDPRPGRRSLGPEEVEARR